MRKISKAALASLVFLCSTPLLFSCSSNEDSTTNDIILAMQFDNYFESSRNIYDQGYGYFISLRAEKGALIATDRNGNAPRVSMIDTQVDAIEDIEEGYERIIKGIHEEKRKILAAIGAQSALSKLRDDYMYPARIDARKIKDDEEDYFHSDEVLRSVVRYRDAVVKICANSHYRSINGELQRDKSRAIGEISRKELKGDESDSQYFRELLQNVYPEDKVFLFEILLSLTPRTGEDQTYSAQQALHFLCIQESRILLARKKALGLIKSRVSSDCYSFDTIMPLAYGPSYSEKGEEVEIKVLMAAFDSTNNPEVTCEQGGVIKVHEGVATLRVKVDETTTLNGTITVVNKAGARKTKEWKVTVPVMD
ncbi:MAG: hypothetical protein NXI10_08405 [bacterium]|nr:hypothetical protein [bacterium]